MTEMFHVVVRWKRDDSILAISHALTKETAVTRAEERSKSLRADEKVCVEPVNVRAAR